MLGDFFQRSMDQKQRVNMKQTFPITCKLEKKIFKFKVLSQAEAKGST